MRVAIVGASGLVGSELTEFYMRSGVEVVPLIHTSGNAWRLAAAGTKLTIVDLLQPNSLSKALEGCTHVVNCTRGDKDVMLSGLNNLLSWCSKTGVKQFLHISSVAIYGDPPTPASVTEIEPESIDPNSYGGLKLAQDKMVQKAARKGLNAVIACPPNIIGPYSYFLLQLVDAIRAGQFALVGDGESCCSTVDVRNLVNAIDLLLKTGTSDGQRYFVTDDETVTWKRMIEELKPLTGNFVLPLVDESALPAVSPGRRISVLRSIKHLVSSDVREAMRKDPLFNKIDVALRNIPRRMGPKIENRVKHMVEGPLRVPLRSQAVALNGNLCRQQLRHVEHSCARLKSQVGYRAQTSFSQSMAAFRAFYSKLILPDQESVSLLRNLEVAPEI